MFAEAESTEAKLTVSRGNSLKSDLLYIVHEEKKNVFVYKFMK